MAVGIPKSPATQKSSNCIRLDYPGKKSREEILATKPCLYKQNRLYSGKPNRLYRADNLGVLAEIAMDSSLAGHIRLVYIDPPFASAAVYESRKQKHAYDDHIVGFQYIESLRERLILIHEILAEDGSLYLHLDERMAFHFRIILDEIFGQNNFRNIITRKKCNPKNYTRNTFGNIADYILFYTKSSNYVWNRQFEPWDDCKASKEYPCVDENGRRYKKVPIHAPGVRNGETGKAWKGMMPPPGKHWQFVPSTLDAMNERGEIYWSPTGNPRRKIYLDNSQGIPLQNIWMNMKDAHNQNIKITGYPTEKNPSLLQNIILASSNPGDIVLDCYAGSGTTLDVASKLDRRWIGIDNSNEAIETTLKRFKQGTQRMGDYVTKGISQISLPLPDRISDFTLYETIPSNINITEDSLTAHSL